LLLLLLLFHKMIYLRSNLYINYDCPTGANLQYNCLFVELSQVEVIDCSHQTSTTEAVYRTWDEFNLLVLLNSLVKSLELCTENI